MISSLLEWCNKKPIPAIHFKGGNSNQGGNQGSNSNGMVISLAVNVTEINGNNIVEIIATI